VIHDDFVTKCLIVDFYVKLCLVPFSNLKHSTIFSTHIWVSRMKKYKSKERRGRQTEVHEGEQKLRWRRAERDLDLIQPGVV